MATVVALPLLGWTAIAMLSDDDGPGDGSTTTAHSGHGSLGETATTSPPATAPTIRPAAPTENDEPSPDAGTDAEDLIAACADRLAAGDAVVAEAKTGVGHWFEHIKARTDLLEGRNTQEETKAIWKRTREAGPADLERFDKVMKTYNKRSGCDALADLKAPAKLRDDLHACIDRSAMTAKAVRAASAAIGDWASHLQAMAEHKDGHMDAEEAQEKWVEAWEKAPTNINAFRAAREDLEQAPSCPGADE